MRTAKPAGRGRASLIGCLLICAALIFTRTAYSGLAEPQKPFTVTQWDAFGYYLYTPAVFIYGDCQKLKWIDSIDQRYNVSGGGAMPVIPHDNGNKVDKYFCGVALLQTPIFCLAHLYAHIAGYPADGFSPPYEYALAYGVLLYCLLALFLLRKVLLRYFDDRTVGVTLALLCMASNFVQYAAVDNGLSHAYIFPLYVLMIWLTARWHDRPSATLAACIGYVAGLATICRPTEAIIFLIPLLWNTHNRSAASFKWKLVRNNRAHIFLAVAGGLAGILPQLLYWKVVTGSFIYDVGSKWVFLNPWFRVLTGWEKGWFIYTPVTLLFVGGLFFIRNYVFRYSVLIFCLLNIWIVISWDEWQYGASYATRALVQSYPVFALPLAAAVERISRLRLWYLLLAISAYLTGVNLFQVWQYNRTILHYSDMNRRYYSRIYLNPDPTPLDMSLLDTGDWPGTEKGFKRQLLLSDTCGHMLQLKGGEGIEISEVLLPTGSSGKDQWLKISIQLTPPFNSWRSWLCLRLIAAATFKETKLRLDNPVGSASGAYACYMRVPATFKNPVLRAEIKSDFDFHACLESQAVELLELAH